MAARTLCASALALALALSLASAVAAPEQAEPGELTPEQILDRVDDLFRGTSSHAEMAMTVISTHWTREMVLEAWSLGEEHSLIRVLEPRKERGTATLKAEGNIWNYLPKVRRVIKVPSSMMGSSWMGSHFTNDDLIKEYRMADDYRSAISFRGERGGARVIELTLVPKPEAAIVWGKVVVTVGEDDLLPQQILYLDEDMELARTMTFSDVRELGGRRLPARMRVVPADEPEESTEVVYHALEFDVDLDEGFFSLRNLEKAGR